MKKLFISKAHYHPICFFIDWSVALIHAFNVSPTPSPLKALADLVYVQKHNWLSAAPVVESLRVDPEFLADLTGELFDEVMSAYKPGRVSRFLAGLREDLSL